MNDNYPTVSSTTDNKGNVKTTETYDRGSYIEIITKVETPNGQVDIYVNKKSK